MPIKMALKDEIHNETTASPSYHNRPYNGNK